MSDERDPRGVTTGTVTTWLDQADVMIAGQPMTAVQPTALADLRSIADAALALSRAVEPADLPAGARPLLLALRAHLAATGVDPVGE